MAMGDFWRLIVEFTFNEVDIYRCDLAYRQETNYLLAQPQEELVLDWYAQCQGPFATILPAAWAVIGVRSRGLTNPLLGHDGTTRFNGARAGDALPPTNTGIINFKTGFIGRSFQGRNQLPAPVEGDQANGTLSTDYVDDATAYGESLKELHDALTGLSVTWRHVVWSDVLNTGTPVTAYLIRGVTGNQETRKTGRGS